MATEPLAFEKIFTAFLRASSHKVIYVASCSNDVPNCAPKMLITVKPPKYVYFLDYKFTKTFQHISANSRISVSLMDDVCFEGYRLTGDCKVLSEGKEFTRIEKIWQEKLTGYLADRIMKRVRGEYSAKIAEESLPPGFLIVKMCAREGAVVKPDRILRAGG